MFRKMPRTHAQSKPDRSAANHRCFVLVVVGKLEHFHCDRRGWMRIASTGGSEKHDSNLDCRCDCRSPSWRWSGRPVQRVGNKQSEKWSTGRRNVRSISGTRNTEADDSQVQVRGYESPDVLFSSRVSTQCSFLSDQIPSFRGKLRPGFPAATNHPANTKR